MATDAYAYALCGRPRPSAAPVLHALDKATGVRATEVAGDSVDKVVEEFKELVQKNTE